MENTINNTNMELYYLWMFIVKFFLNVLYTGDHIKKQLGKYAHLIFKYPANSKLLTELYFFLYFRKTDIFTFGEISIMQQLNNITKKFLKNIGIIAIKFGKIHINKSIKQLFRYPFRHHQKYQPAIDCFKQLKHSYHIDNWIGLAFFISIACGYHNLKNKKNESFIHYMENAIKSLETLRPNYINFHLYNHQYLHQLNHMNRDVYNDYYNNKETD